MLVVCAGATGRAGVRAIGVACGALAGRDRTCARRAQKEVAQRFRKVREGSPVTGVSWCHPVVVLRMRKRWEVAPETVLLQAKAERQRLEPSAGRERAWRASVRAPSWARAHDGIEGEPDATSQ